MSGMNVYIVNTNSRIDGFESRVCQLALGDESISQRIARQLTQSNINYQKTSSDQNLDLEGKIIFFDDTVYSDTLVKYILKNNLKYSITERTQINQAWNSSFCKWGQEIWENLPFKSFGPVLENKPIIVIDLNLPEKIYGKDRFVAAAPEFFYQKISDWPDLLKAQSLCARELSGINAKKLKPFFSDQFILRLSENSFFRKFSNKIGKNCRIHPTAIIEGSCLGDNVEIGPYCFIRASTIGSDTTVREHSSIKMSTIGAGSYILPCDILNSYLGEQTCITTSILFHTVIGSGTFLGGAVGFADLNANRSFIQLDQSNGNKTESDQIFLGSMVAENCFIGAGLLFHSGQRIAHSTTILNQNMIQKSDFKAGRTYVARSDKLISIPQQFIERNK